MVDSAKMVDSAMKADSAAGGTIRIAVLAGDGIGPEVIDEALRVLRRIGEQESLALQFEAAPVGGAAVDSSGDPLPPATLALARASAAILFGAVGGPRYDSLPRDQRPERGLLRLRKELGLFANLRPAVVYPQLAAASTLRPEVLAGLDLLIVRELTGDVYFGEPRGIRELASGEREGYDTMRYSESEVRRIAHVAFRAAQSRRGKLCSVDKANVLETSQLWRSVVTETARDYPQVELSHQLVDNAAMQLLRNPRQFDVIVTGNLFGDILSDEASMLTGSIGMLPSASLDADLKGMYEPIHGSAPDIAGRGVANPLAAILSAALMLRYSLRRADCAARIEGAVARVLASGLRCADIAAPGEPALGTRAMGDAVLAAL